MNDIGTRLREARIKKGFNQGELAELLQCSSKAISRYENNDNLDKVYDFVKMCECLGADISYIVTGIEKSNGKEITFQEQQVLSAYRRLVDSDKRIVDFILGIKEYDIKDDPIRVEPTKIYYFPVFYQSAAAGIGQLSETNEYQMEELEIKSIPKEAKFGMYIKGNSMETDIYDTDIVLIDPSQTIPDRLDDKIVVALFGDELVCKKLSINNDTQTYDFISNNSEANDKSKFNQKQNDFKLVGRVVKVIHADIIGNGIIRYRSS